MVLPGYVTELIDALEDRGYETWAVGGCVRDDRLGIPPHDFDLYTAALPPQIQEVFSHRNLVLAGVKHGTVGVVTDSGVVEITTFRTEGDYSDARHPGWVRFVPTVGEDLARRDFTINAMAYSPTRGYADPFGGLTDLERGILRAVGDPVRRFREDALRILRGARFTARFGLEIEDATWQAMLEERSGLDALARERVLEELTQLICLANAAQLGQFAPLLAQVIPELGPTIGFDQHSPHHAYDVFTHTALVVAGVPPVPKLRLAALLHDVGKPGCFTTDETGRGHFYGHAQRSAQMAEEILRGLKAPNDLREDVVWLIDHHMMKTLTEPKALRRALSRYGLASIEDLLDLQTADLLGKGTGNVAEELAQLSALRQSLRELDAQEGRMTLKRLAVKGQDLLDLGFPPSPELGKALNELLQLVLAGELPNDREALLAKARTLQ